MPSKRTLAKVAVSALCALTVGVALPAAAGEPGHHFRAEAHDMGATAPASTVTTSIILNVTDPTGLRNFVAATVTPGNPLYHQFLTVDQFRDRFAPSDRQIGQLENYLQSFGIRVDKVYADHLDITVTGTAAELNAAFSTQLRDYTRHGNRFHRPDSKFVVPGTLAKLVLAVPGLTNEPGSFRPMLLRLGEGAYSNIAPPAVQWPRGSTAGDVAGDYTVGDVARFYDINPLYRQGITGQGQTVGIMTLANFRKADAYSYWHHIGLSVPQHRIRKIMVDGGTQVAPGAGDNETSLDVEQSGGIAPQAQIRVYIAPNTGQGFLDLFYTAASDNVADTVSISWGEPEELYFAALNSGVDYTGQLQAIDQALLEGAAQGQSYFAASGDSGAYDINNFQIAPVPQYSKQLTVDSPADDPYITAAGGTTVAATIPGIPSLGCPQIVIPRSRVWGWDYLYRDWSSCLGLGLDAFFPGGGGGGVSSYWPIPSYQASIAGMQQTQPDQSLIYYPNYPSTKGSQNLITLPADFPGRNLPDLALNADPQTGYLVVDCTDFRSPTHHSCTEGGWGGTSFVAPQLNGMTALVDQASGGRAGLLNPMLYGLDSALADTPFTPFNDITAGNNWFYRGVRGYDDGAGLGTLDVARLAQIFQYLSPHRFSLNQPPRE